MSYTTNELALLDLISNVNKIFYYVGEDGDLIDEFDVKQLDKAVASFKQSIKLGEHEFLDEAKNYWDDMYDDVVQELIEDTSS